jgi:CBS-domain-containing membrane protein
VLIYGAIDAPLAQPRALFGGHFIGALTGVIVTKLFRLLPTEERYEELSWLAGSIACATSIVLMQMTKTTHPPAGA